MTDGFGHGNQQAVHRLRIRDRAERVDYLFGVMVLEMCVLAIASFGFVASNSPWGFVVSGDVWVSHKIPVAVGGDC